MMLQRLTILIATICAIAAATLPVSSQSLPSPERADGNSGVILQPDFEALRTIPLARIAEEALFEQLGRVTPGKHNYFQSLAPPSFKIEIPSYDPTELTPEQNVLLWLLLLNKNISNDGRISIFFFTPAGDYAPQVADALKKARIQPQATVLAKALKLFGEPYPDDVRIRYPESSWNNSGKMEKARPNLDDLKILEKDFGSQKQFSGQIDTYIRNTPRLLTLVEAARPEVEDDARLWWLLEQITIDDPEDMSKRIQTWKRPYQILYLLGVFYAEVINGGANQFFFNSSGILAFEVKRALREIGLYAQADALQKGMGTFPFPYPIDTEARRRFLYEQTTEERADWNDKLNALTDDILKVDILDHMLALAKRENILPY